MNFHPSCWELSYRQSRGPCCSRGASIVGKTTTFYCLAASFIRVSAVGCHIPPPTAAATSAVSPLLRHQRLIKRIRGRHVSSRTSAVTRCLLGAIVPAHRRPLSRAAAVSVSGVSRLICTLLRPIEPLCPPGLGGLRGLLEENHGCRRLVA